MIMLMVENLCVPVIPVPDYEFRSFLNVNMLFSFMKIPLYDVLAVCYFV